MDPDILPTEQLHIELFPFNLPYSSPMEHHKASRLINVGFMIRIPQLRSMHIALLFRIRNFISQPVIEYWRKSDRILANATIVYV
jgi:hypothetical protein